MQLADHIYPLLRDHDCVIIPDFGGLVAEPVPAQFAAARQHLAPPAKQVAFNQSLTRNDGLLVDALSQHLRIPATQAREVLRHAVEDMHQELRQQQRTELPGIGVFRQAPGRGLLFDYTGTDNLLPAAFGLPALSVRPVLATDARLAREKRPALLQATPRRRAAPAAPTAATPRLAGRWRRQAGVGIIASLLVSASYLLGVNAGVLPAAWRPYPAAAGGVGNAARPAGAASLAAPTPPPAPEPQQATLAHNGWSSAAEAPTAPTAPTHTQELPAADRPAPEAGPGPAATTLTAVSPATAAVVAAATASAAGAPAAASKASLPRRAAPPAAARPVLAGRLARRNRANPPGEFARKPRLLALPPRRPAAAAAAGRPAAMPAGPRRLNLAAVKPLLPGAATPPVLPAASAAAAATAEAAAATINRPLGRSYVVAGAFDTKAGAEACRRHLVRGGFAQAKVLLPSRTTRRFRATVADYADLPRARAAAAQLRFQRKTFFDVYSY